MKKKLFLLLVPLLFASISFGGLNSHAQTTSTIADVNKIAQKTPRYVMGEDDQKWKDVTSYNTKPLYDFNNNLIAYSVDLKSNVDNSKAYAIISVNEEDAPVLEFSEGHTSPFDQLDANKVGIYDGAVSYYSKETTNAQNQDTYYDMRNHAKLTDQEVKVHKDLNKDKKYISSKPEISKSERNQLTSGIIQPMDIVLTSKTLNVPDYYWYRGCTPTAVSMVLKYRFSSKLSSVYVWSLIDKLANAFGTDSNGGTYVQNVPAGVKKVMSGYGVTVNAYNDSNGASKSGNTFTEYTNEINKNYPVVVNVFGSKETAPSYPNGFGNHSMAGVGYRITTSYSFVTVHDTGIDGNVYCNYDSSAFGTPWWTYIH